MNNAQFEDALGELFSRVIAGSGTLDTDVRLAIANGKDMPQEFATLTHKIHQHAYRVTDEDVDSVLQAGFHQEDVFEAVVSGAVGASVARCRVYLEKREEATDAS